MAKFPVHNLEEIKHILKALPADAFVVGLFIHFPQCSQDEWLNPLAKRLSEAGYVTVGLRTPTSGSQACLDQADYQAIVEADDVAALGRINVFIISDKDSWAAPFPAESKVLGCYHAFECAYDTSFPCIMHHAALIDGWLYTAPFSRRTRALVNELYEGAFSAAACPRGRANFHFIPMGYPRMGMLIEKLAQTNASPDSILYAPTDIDGFYEHGGERLKKSGARLIRTLLDNFPHHNVIFRPFRRNQDHPDVKNILNAFSEHPRFIYDEHPEKIFSFSRAEALVTDLSAISNSFSFSTLRPSIFFQPWQKASQSHRNYVNAFYAISYTELVETIKKALADADAIRAKILRYRELHAASLDDIFGSIAALLPDFHAGRTHPDWISLRRIAAGAPPDDLDLAFRALAQPRAAIPWVLGTMAVFSRPDSPLMLALALHKGMEIIPETFYFQSLSKVVEKALGYPFPCALYKQTNPEDVRRLYSLHLLASLRKGDMRGRIFAEEMLAAFNALFPPVSAASQTI